MTFQILPLDPAAFLHLFGASAATLEAAGAIAYQVDEKPGFPCRVSLEDAAPGGRCLLVNYEHLAVATPYRSAHAIFVVEGAEAVQLAPGTVPEMIASRMVSVRAFDATGMMLHAELAQGTDVAATLERLLGLEGAAQAHIHSATRGCYMARAVTASE